METGRRHRARGERDHAQGNDHPVPKIRALNTTAPQHVIFESRHAVGYKTATKSRCSKGTRRPQLVIYGLRCSWSPRPRMSRASRLPCRPPRSRTCLAASSGPRRGRRLHAEPPLDAVGVPVTVCRPCVYSEVTTPARRARRCPPGAPTSSQPGSKQGFGGVDADAGRAVQVEPLRRVEPPWAGALLQRRERRMRRGRGGPRPTARTSSRSASPFARPP